MKVIYNKSCGTKLICDPKLNQLLQILLIWMCSTLVNVKLFIAPFNQFRISV